MWICILIAGLARYWYDKNKTVAYVLVRRKANADTEHQCCCQGLKDKNKDKDLMSKDKESSFKDKDLHRHWYTHGFVCAIWKTTHLKHYSS